MKDLKIVKVTIKENEIQLISSYYEMLGFELVQSKLMAHRNRLGVVIDEFYENVYKFDFKQANANELWHRYKVYKKKNAELRSAISESNGNMELTKSFVPIGIVLMIVAFLFIPVAFGNGFGEFVSWKIGWVSSYKSFDIGIFIAAVVISPLLGFFLSLCVQLILFMCNRNKRLLKAIERIPKLEEEIQELIYGK